eukprot:TRINITY_DN2644_c0_g1_i1.p1 TRINITY_DN2644_c0_g1~~TRINITY_DN2644_c0_g1_i1.p1  ORF type:complete len:287 (+),score=41.80 TRINITY_DN2644_c0_g1_i1:244-1104(+)
MLRRDLDDEGKVCSARSDTRIFNSSIKDEKIPIAKVTKSPRLNSAPSRVGQTEGGGLLQPPTLFYLQKYTEQAAGNTNTGFLLPPPLSAPSSPGSSSHVKTKRTFDADVKVLRAISVGGVFKPPTPQEQPQRSQCFSQHLLLQAAAENNSQKMKFILSTSKNMNMDFSTSSIQPLVANAPAPKNTYGFTPLYYTVKNNNREIAELLLTKHRASPDYPIDDDETTVLMHADTVEIASLLIRHGAKVEKKNKLEKTALDYAVERKNDDVVQFLKRCSRVGDGECSPPS